MKLPVTFFVSAILTCLTSFAVAATCNIGDRGLRTKNLGLFNNDWELVAQSNRQRKITIDRTVKSARLGIEIPTLRARPAGMILVKVTDFGIGEGGTNNIPESVRLSRTESKRYAWFRRINKVDVKRLDLERASARTLEYTLAHLLLDRLNLTGDLRQFHASYASAGRNKDTYQKEIERRMIYAFDDIMLNLPRDQRTSLRVALSNISQNEFVQDTIAKVIPEISDIQVPKLSTEADILGLEARHFYHEPLQSGQKIQVCLRKRPTPGAITSKLEVYDLTSDQVGTRGEPSLVNTFEIKWD